MDRVSLYKLSGLPDSFGVVMLSFFFILLLAPYFSGADFGLFKIPIFTAVAKKRLKLIGPFAFLICLLSYVPLFPVGGKADEHGAKGTPAPSPVAPELSLAPLQTIPAQSPAPTSTILPDSASPTESATPVVTTSPLPTPTPIVINLAGTVWRRAMGEWRIYFYSEGICKHTWENPLPRSEQCTWTLQGNEVEVLFKGGRIYDSMLNKYLLYRDKKEVWAIKGKQMQLVREYQLMDGRWSEVDLTNLNRVTKIILKKME